MNPPVRTRSGAAHVVVLLEEPVGGDAPRKAAFKKEAMRLLESLAAALELPKGAFDLRWNEGGPAVSGEATLHAEEIYVQVSQSCISPVMYRRCAGRRDYRGHQNRWAGAELLADPYRLADHIAQNLGLERSAPARLL